MRTGVFNQHFSVHAIAGTHVITLALDAKPEAAANLLGFAFFRKKFDKNGKFLEEAWMEGYKPFEAVVPDPRPGVRYPTNLHPIQSFVWADFAVSQDRKYEYQVFPVTGTPADPVLGTALSIKVAPEPYKHKLHEIYFNRAVAASQAYVERFHNIRPNAKSLDEEQKQERYDWLSRGLYEAVVAFINQAKDSRFGLRVAMYELDFPEIPVLFKAALDRGADVQIIYEARGHDSQTRQNEAALKAAGFTLNDRRATFARKNTDGIPHNKFMVLLKDGKPVMVWTGSTNLSEGGIFGHSNVGHCIKDKALAAHFLQYWNLLKADPKIGELAKQVSEIWPDVDLDTLPKNKMTPIFSPRKGLKMLDFYANVFGSAQKMAAITLPFNLDKRFVAKIDEQSPAVRYIMLNSGRTNEAVAEKYNADPDVIAAAGSKMNNNFGQWLNEIHTGFNGSNAQYIHTKFLLKDPLGPEPVVITGSANFSEPSTNKNDENMVIIPCSNKPGETRVQDIYLGEYFRLFDHLYFRYLSGKDTSSDEEKQKRRFLKPRPQDWVSGYYKAGSDRFKRRVNFSFGFG